MHVPKSAGTSINTHLKKTLDENNIEYYCIIQDIRNMGDHPLWAIWGAHIPRKNIHMWIDVPENVWLVARNPWDRMLSFWQHHMADNSAMMVAGRLGPRYAVKYWDTLKKWMKHSHSFMGHRHSILHWGDSNDHIILYDHLEEGVNTMFKSIGLDMGSLPKENVSPKPSHSIIPIDDTYWETHPECVEYIYNEFRDEINEFGFKAPI